MPLLYHAYVYLEFLIFACTIYILAPPGTEDEDVEIIISNLMSIGRHQSMKMFDYGVLFTERENKQ